MKPQTIYISSIGSVSPLGSTQEEIWENYTSSKHFFIKKDTNWIATISHKNELKIQQLRKEDKKYKNLDRSVLLAILASRIALKNTTWNDNFGINIGSSRGATELFEQYYNSFLNNNRAETLTSPTTTLGNISSWVANDLRSNGFAFSHSVTCSSALHALLNGIAWINAGMSNQFLVGGSEAPLTSFTIAQMQALKINAKNNDAFPCKSLDFAKSENTMILGESAVCMAIEKEIKPYSLAKIEGIGFGNEELLHNVSISEQGVSLQKSMRMALENTQLSDVDAIVMHAPGTVKGDISEWNAVKNVFGDTIPAITSNKWKIGHTLGASGAMSLEFAVLMLQHQQWIGNPFYSTIAPPKKLNKILVNAVGFGGNAVSILLSKV